MRLLVARAVLDLLVVAQPAPARVEAAARGAVQQARRALPPHVQLRADRQPAILSHAHVRHDVAALVRQRRHEGACEVGRTCVLGLAPHAELGDRRDAHGRATRGGEQLTPHGRRRAALEVSAAAGSGAWLHGVLGDGPDAAVLGADGACRLEQ